MFALGILFLVIIIFILIKAMIENTVEETAKKYGVNVSTLYYWNRLYGNEVAVVKAVELYHKRG